MKIRNPLLVLIWTFGLFVLGNMVLYPAFFISASWLGLSVGDIASGATKTPETILVKGLCGLVLGFPLIWVLIRFLWRRSMTWVGFRFSGRAFGTGAIAGLVVGGVAMGLLLLLGAGSITAGPSRFAASELLYVMVGLLTWTSFKTLLEEVIFRGMATREFAHKWNWPVATILGGVFFAAAHMISLGPILTVPLALAILSAGILVNALFVTLYLRGGSLSLPWGFHFGWNLALSALFGTVMSGQDRSFGLWRVELSGSPLLTGGTFGPELSVLSLSLMVLVILVVRRGGLGGLPEAQGPGYDQND